MNSLSNNEKYFISNSLDGIDVITENINSNALLIDGSNFMTADLDAGGHNIKNMADAINIDEAVTLGQLNQCITAFVDLSSNQTIGGIKTFTDIVNFNGATKTNLTLEDIPDGATRQALTTATQTIGGIKTFTDTVNFNNTCNMNNVLQLNSGNLTTDTTVDASNKTNTYISFGPAGANTDWAYLRQIGGSDDMHLAFDFHDTATDGKFSLRTINSTATPDATPSTFFYSSLSDTTISSTKLNATGNAKITGQLDVSGTLNIQDNKSLYIGGVNSVNPYGIRVHYNTSASNVGVIDFSGTALLIRKSEAGVANNKLTIDNVNINTYAPIVRNAWSSGELIQTRIINPSTLPVTSGVRNVSAGASLDWLFPSITLKNTPTNSIIVFSVDAPYFLSDFNKDQIELTIYDTTGGGASIVYRKTQYWEGSFGGGTRGSPILPLTFSHTPSIATTTLARTYTINIINRSNDTLYLCQGLINTTITNMDYYTIELKEIKI